MSRSKWSGAAFVSMIAVACHGVAVSDERETSALRIVVDASAGDAVIAAAIAPRRDGFQRAAASSTGAGWVSEGWRNAEAQAYRDLGARLPDLADGEIEVGASRFVRTQLRIRLEHANPSRGVLDEGRVVYPNVMPGVDRVLVADRFSLEELLVVRSELAPRDFAWHVTMPEGIHSARIEGGELAFLDASEHSVVSVLAPYLLDAHGARRNVALQWDAANHAMRIHVDTEGLAFPIVVDPRYSSFAWARRTPATTPSGREGAAMVFDAARGEVVMFGGYDTDGNADNQTWRWNGTTWAQAAPPTSPSARGEHAMVYDANAMKVVLFGGFDTLPRNDTWLWDGATWTIATSHGAPGSPSPRAGHAMAYDDARRETILFSGSSAPADTWRWNGAAWSRVTTATAPPPRDNHVMGYDAARSEIVLFGGRSTVPSPLGDTWRWNGTAWTEAVVARPPSPRLYASAAVDTLRGQLFVFGGLLDSNETIAWDGREWSAVAQTNAPGPRSFASMAYDGARRELVVFGGQDGVGAAVAETWTMYGLGLSCATQADCPGAYCTDGVCCSVSACGTCESCDGFTRGECSPVFNRSDPDTCSSEQGKSCDNDAKCKKARGEAATSASECATGFLVDGVCCETASCGRCQTCNANAKEVVEFPGQCSATRAGTDPKNECADEGAAACLDNGLCDGGGRCQRYAAGVSCGASTCNGNRATGQVCTGAGVCNDNPSGVECAPFACANGSCASACTTNAECASLHHCEEGRCLADRGAVCDGTTLVGADGRLSSCGLFRCVGVACLQRCVSRLDCAAEADCATDGQCVAFNPISTGAQGGGCTQAPTRNARWLPFGLATLLLRRRRYRATALSA